MTEKPRILGLLTARGGSQRLPRKNVLPFAGKPLIAWTVAAALASRRLDRVVLSTDDPEIMDAARTAGCEVPFARPPALATADAGSVDVALHALDALDGGYDWLVLLQPTSPLRSVADIDGCIDLCLGRGAPSAVSVTPADKAARLLYGRGADGRLARLVAEEDVPGASVLNGAVYVVRCDHLRAERRFVGPETLAYTMPAERSVDIDTALDFAMAEWLALNGGTSS